MLLPCLLIGGCATQQRCLEKWPPVMEVIVRDTIIYRDTVLFITLPPDTVTNSDTIYVDKEGQPFTLAMLVTETDFARAEAWVKDSRLYQRVFNKDTALELRYDSLLKEKLKVVTITETVRIPPKFNGILWQVIALAVLLVLLVFMLKVLR